jgi:tetratricopeptide (TPR) repeat protein
VAPADDGPYDFYISYVSADEEWASWIAWQLEERLRLDDRQPKTFIRAWDVVAGNNEPASMQRALVASERLIAVLTQEYLASAGPGIAEWSTVWADDPLGVQRRVVPVRVKACEPKGFLRTIVPIELVGHNAASASDTLLSGINASLEGRAKPPTAPTFPDSDRPTEDTPPAQPFPGPPVLVGEPPTVPSNWFQDRTAEIEDIERHLGDARTGLVMVVGPEVFGKTAMIHRLWELIRTNASPLHVHGLVYLSARGFWPVTADRLIDDLAAILPKHEAEQLEGTIRQPLAPVDKLVVLLAALARRRVIVAIDALEELLNDDDDIEETALRELVDYLVPRAEQGVQLLLIGRRSAQAVQARFPGVTHRHNLNEGLPEKDAFALLRAMDAEDRLNLDAVPDHDRARLHRLTGGSPRALELVYGVLVSGDFSFTRLLEFMARADGHSMVAHLLAHTYGRLSLQQRHVLQALAVYGRPVPPAAVDHLVRNDLSDVDSVAVLGQLRQRRLAQSDGEHFSVPADQERDYLIGRLREEADAGASETPETLLLRAADYFVGQQKGNPQRLADLRPHLIEIELRLRAEDYRAALERMRAVDNRYLVGWGSSSALETSLRKLLRKGLPRNLEIEAESLLARALMQQERQDEATTHLEHALGLASGIGRMRRRIVLREQLTTAHLQLGGLREATVHSRRACREAMVQLRDFDAMTALAGLAMCRARAGKFRSALRLYARARWLLKLFGTTAYQAHRPTMLYGEAWVHGQRGDRNQAWSLLREGRSQAIELGQRRWEGMCLLSEAQLALDDHKLEHAVALAEEASAIGVRNGNRWLCRVAMEILAMAQLNQGDLTAAARAADIAQRNHGSVLGFGLVGLAAYRRGKDEDARVAFHMGRTARRRDWANERDFQFLDAYGLVACGLALLGEHSYLTIALDTYREAREITTGSGAVERTLMLLDQFEPRADSRILERVRAAAKGERIGPT